MKICMIICKSMQSLFLKVRRNGYYVKHREHNIYEISEEHRKENETIFEKAIRELQVKTEVLKFEI